MMIKIVEIMIMITYVENKKTEGNKLTHVCRQHQQGRAQHSSPDHHGVWMTDLTAWDLWTRRQAVCNL